MRRVLIFIIFAFTACVESVPVTEQKSTEAIDTSDQKDKSQSNEIKDERSDWQKPGFVIQSLGDLSGKTVADIGSGALGYFVIKLVGQTNAEKIIAVDIDKEALNMLNILRSALPSDKSERIDIRLAEESDPNLKDQEVDIILIVNTIAYIPGRTLYLERLKSKLKDNGKLIIIDFKTKRIPDFVDAPPYSEREYLHVIEEELYKAGYNNILTDDSSLEYQYYISAEL